MTRTAFPGLRLTAFGLALAWLPAGLAVAQTTPTDFDRDEILHVLNRTTFGPRPGDVEMVEKMGGVHAYLEQQLHPETIDDSAVEQQLAQLDLLQESSGQLLGIYKAEKEQDKLKKQQEAAAASGTPMANPPPAPAPEKQMQPFGFIGALIRSSSVVGELQQAKLVRAVDSQRQLQEVLVDFWSNHFNIDVKKNLDLRQLPRSARGLGQKPGHAHLSR